MIVTITKSIPTKAITIIIVMFLLNFYEDEFHFSLVNKPHMHRMAFCQFSNALVTENVKTPHFFT